MHITRPDPTCDFAFTAPRTFLWSLSPSDWERVHDLLEPFCHALPPGYFQYLHEHDGTEVIYSTVRGW